MSGVSMEKFGPVAVDYFTQRRVVDVREGTGDVVWTIEFEGGALVHNYDKTLPIPKAIKGAALTRTILGDTRDGIKRVTRLQFGLEEIQLNPTEYTICDPTYTKGQEVWAQRSEANMPHPTPEEPSERLQEGPSAPETDEG